MAKNNRTVLYAWKGDNGKAAVIRDVPPNHDAKENARNVAKLLMEHFPGNANDIFFGAIEEEIKAVLSLENGKDLLLQKYDISNRIRSALLKLIEEE